MFRWKTFMVFITAVAISGVAANYRFGDSAHAIGMLSVKGGKARHPFMVKSGMDRYYLIMTGVVLPPLKGDVRVALEGEPAMNYAIYNSEPVVDLGIHRRPEFEVDLMTGVQSRDTMALWIEMEPQSYDFLFGDAPEISSFGKSSTLGPNGNQPLSLNFYANDTGAQLLGIPVVYSDLTPVGGSNSAHH